MERRPINLQLVRAAVQKLVDGGQYTRFDLFPSLGKTTENTARWHSDFLKRLINAGLVERIGHPKGRPAYIAKDKERLAQINIQTFLWPTTATSSPVDSGEIEIENESQVIEIEEEVDTEEAEEVTPMSTPSNPSPDAELLVLFSHKLDQFITVLESMNERIGKLEGRGGVVVASSGEISIDSDKIVAQIVERLPQSTQPASSFVKPEEAQEIADRLKLLTREKARSFLEKFKISQARFLLAPDTTAGFAFLDELEGRKTPSHPDITSILTRIESRVGVELEEKIREWINDTDSEFVEKVADLEKKLSDKMANNQTLGGGFKTLIDALGDHRKLDKEDREKLLQSIVQAINLSAKQITSLVTSKLPATGGTEAKLDIFERTLKSKIDHMEGKLDGKLRSMQKDFDTAGQAILDLLEQNKLVVAALSKIVRMLPGADLGAYGNLINQKSGLALISTVTDGNTAPPTIKSEPAKSGAK